MRKEVLDHGYVELVEHWGSDERIIEAARMSTQKGFKGWGPFDDGPCGICEAKPGRCWNCRIEQKEHACHHCGGTGRRSKPGDEKLLKYLWDNAHATPFEMAGFIVEVKAPIFVFREWHRHRTQSFNEMSARYIPLPNENYVPTAERLRPSEGTNNQAQGTVEYDAERADRWLVSLSSLYALIDATYQTGLQAGIPKEVARVLLPVGRYSAMRASANLRNWLGFLKLRCDPAAQWEIRQYANAVAEIIEQKFPRVYEVAKESTGLP